MKKLIATILSILALTTNAQIIDGAWSGSLKVGPMELPLVINIVGDKCTLDSPAQGAKGIPSATNHISADSISISIPTIGATYSGKIANGKIAGNFTQMGQSFPLTLSRGIEELNRPQEPKAPFPYTTEEVTFANEAAGATFGGTLTYPVSFVKGKTPVVLLVSGSGQQNRNEEVFEHKPFLVIADYLARNGIATLRYDDRGVGASKGGELKTATTKEFADDATAGVNLLRSLKKFGKVGVLGHSEGANIAFMIAAKGKADFIISMAGIGVKGDTALTAQANRILKLQGNPMQMTVSQYRFNVSMQNLPWLNWLIEYDPQADIAAAKCPVMAINGNKDCQVISEINLQAIKATLPQNSKNMVKEYPDLNHLFQHCTTGLPTEYRTIEQTIFPKVLTDIATWIHSIK